MTIKKIKATIEKLKQALDLSDACIAICFMLFLIGIMLEAKKGLEILVFIGIIAIGVYLLLACVIRVFRFRLNKRKKQLKDQLTIEFQKVQIDFDTCKKLSMFLDNEYVEFFAKIDRLNESIIVIKIMFEGYNEGKNVKVERDFIFEKSDIEFIDIESK